jgi:hypothetical protein
MNSTDKTNQEVRPYMQLLLFVTMMQTFLIIINILGQLSSVLYFWLSLTSNMFGYLMYPMAFFHILFFFFSMSIVIYAYYKKRKSQLAFERKTGFVKLHTYFIGYYIFSAIYMYLLDIAIINMQIK